LSALHLIAYSISL